MLKSTGAQMTTLEQAMIQALGVNYLNSPFQNEYSLAFALLRDP